MKWQLLYADPPWHYANWTAKKNGAAVAHYPGAKVDEMCSWDIAALAEKDALLFMWATLPKLDEALAVLSAWGFKFVGVPFVWTKTCADGIRPAHGPGFWTASGAEIMLLGRRGKGLPRRRETRGYIKQVMAAPALKPHSRKPTVFADRITYLVDPCSKLELFARRVEGQPLSYLDRPDWSATGLEWDGHTIAEFIARQKREARAHDPGWDDVSAGAAELATHDAITTWRHPGQFGPPDRVLGWGEPYQTLLTEQRKLLKELTT